MEKFEEEMSRRLTNFSVFNEFFGKAVDAFVLVDTSGTIIVANATFQHLIGVEEEVRGRKLQDYVSKESREIFLKMFSGWSKGVHFPVREIWLVNRKGKRLEWYGLLTEIEDPHLLIKISEEGAFGLSEDALPDYTSILSELNKFSLEIFNDQYGELTIQVIIDKLRKITGALITSISLYNPKTGKLKWKEVSQANRGLIKAAAILGKSVTEYEWTPPDEWYHVITKQKVFVMEGSYDLAFGNLPRGICRALDYFLNIGYSYALVINQGEDLYGAAVVLMPKDAPVLPLNILEIYANTITAYYARNKRLEDTIHYEIKLRKLHAMVKVAEELERRRLAQGLHDDVIQELGRALSRIKTCLQSEGAASQAAMPELKEIVEHCLTATRSLTFELSPPLLHEVGLTPALDWLVESMSEKYDPEYILLQQVEGIQLHPELRVTLFHILRELCVNAGKHANAKSVKVGVKMSDTKLELSVIDDGVGISEDIPAPAINFGRGFGLFSIRERILQYKGEFSIDSKKGEGVRASVVIPDINNYIVK